VVWYHRLIGETEGPTLITDTACTATSCRFPCWHADTYPDAGECLNMGNLESKSVPLLPRLSLG
jgi:hypothetical protein